VRATMASIVSPGRRSPPSRATIALCPGAIQAVEGQVDNVRVGGECRLVVRLTGQQKQDPSRGNPIQALLDHFERGLVDPMGVLENHSAGCRAANPAADRPGRPASVPAALEGSGRAGRIALRRPARAGRRPGARVAPVRPVEQRLQLVQPGLNRVVRAQAQARAVQLLDHRPQRAVSVVR
jgi:hypothetical protein